MRFVHEMIKLLKFITCCIFWVGFKLQNKKDLLIVVSALTPINIIHIDMKRHLRLFS